MTLRLSPDEATALRDQAEREHRSMQDIARQALRDYLEAHGKRAAIDAVLDSELSRYAEALERLGK